MSDKPLALFEQVTSSQNILVILIGAVIWYLGYWVWFVGPFFIVAGFGLTCISTVQSAMTRPVTSAFPGLLLGGLIQVLGYYLTPIPLLGWVIGPGFIVFGGILILFYGSSLALQRADIPIVKDLEDFIESRKKKTGPKADKDKDSEEEAVDVKEVEEEEDPEE